MECRCIACCILKLKNLAVALAVALHVAECVWVAPMTPAQWRFWFAEFATCHLYFYVGACDSECRRRCAFRRLLCTVCVRCGMGIRSRSITGYPRSYRGRVANTVALSIAVVVVRRRACFLWSGICSRELLRVMSNLRDRGARARHHVRHCDAIIKK